MIIILYWVLVDHRRVNWEVGGFFVLVAVSNINLFASLSAVEVESSWPLERSHDNDSVGHVFSIFTLVLG